MDNLGHAAFAQSNDEIPYIGMGDIKETLSVNRSIGININVTIMPVGSLSE